LESAENLRPLAFTAERPPRSEVPRRVGAIGWLLAMVILLLTISYVAPYIAGEIQYAITRGRQRAEFDLAGEQLPRTSLGEISRGSQLVTQRIAPSVVIINVNSDVPLKPAVSEEPFLRAPGPQTPETLGQGSGVVVGSDGYILTNHHVVRDAQDIRVTLSDGRRVKAERVGVDSLTDLALLKVEARGLTPAVWGDSDELQVGSLIWAVGSPFGLERSVSFGILSAKNRGGVAGSPHQDFLQTDAAVNPGNSGGPLVDSSGAVVGINTAIVGPTYSGVSFAIPSNVARQVADRLKEGGYVARGWLGVELREVSDERADVLGIATNSPRGAFISRVVDDGRPSPAKEAGIEEGDVVVRWNGADVASPASLTQLVAKTQIGARVEVDIVRNRRSAKLQVTVRERPQVYSR
jgi:S1-C subfamily serine protease